MSERVVEPGVIEVVYASAEEMRPQAQMGLRRLLDEALAAGPVVLVFCVRRVPTVDAEVPKYWAEVTKQLAPRLCGVAVASPSMAVRAAARAFAVANTLRRVDIDVQAFSDEVQALAWARQRRAGSGQR